MAACVLLGWADLLPPILRYGLDFRAEALPAFGPAVALPMSALPTLAWRNARPILAAFIVTAQTTLGLLIGIAFAISIAIHGFERWPGRAMPSGVPLEHFR